MGIEVFRFDCRKLRQHSMILIDPEGQGAFRNMDHFLFGGIAAVEFHQPGSDHMACGILHHHLAVEVAFHALQIHFLKAEGFLIIAQHVPEAAVAFPVLAGQQPAFDIIGGIPGVYVVGQNAPVVDAHILPAVEFGVSPALGQNALNHHFPRPEIIRQGDLDRLCAAHDHIHAGKQAGAVGNIAVFGQTGFHQGHRPEDTLFTRLFRIRVENEHLRVPGDPDHTGLIGGGFKAIENAAVRLCIGIVLQHRIGHGSEIRQLILFQLQRQHIFLYLHRLGIPQAEITACCQPKLGKQFHKGAVVVLQLRKLEEIATVLIEVLIVIGIIKGQSCGLFHIGDLPHHRQFQSLPDGVRQIAVALAQFLDHIPQIHQVIAAAPVGHSADTEPLGFVAAPGDVGEIAVRQFADHLPPHAVHAADHIKNPV